MNKIISMLKKEILKNPMLTLLVRVLQVGLFDLAGACRCCNSLEWNDHSSSLRLVIHRQIKRSSLFNCRF